MAWMCVGGSGIERNLFPGLDNLAGRRTNRLGGKEEAAKFATWNLIQLYLRGVFVRYV
jgi:hypothetical protein